MSDLEQMVFRVLCCLRVQHENDPRTVRSERSLAEVTGLYNQIYPPKKRELVFFPTSPVVIHEVLAHCVGRKLVREEVYSIIYIEVLKEPTKYYALTQAGLQYLGKRKR